MSRFTYVEAILKHLSGTGITVVSPFFTITRRRRGPAERPFIRARRTNIPLIRGDSYVTTEDGTWRRWRGWRQLPQPRRFHGIVYVHHHVRQ